MIREDSTASARFYEEFPSLVAGLSGEEGRAAP